MFMLNAQKWSLLKTIVATHRNLPVLSTAHNREERTSPENLHLRPDTSLTPFASDPGSPLSTTHRQAERKSRDRDGDLLLNGETTSVIASTQGERLAAQGRRSKLSFLLVLSRLFGIPDSKFLVCVPKISIVPVARSALDSGFQSP